MLDNHVTHKHPEARAWLETKSRLRLHVVPISCSWLSLVERSFARITARKIQRGSFESVKALEGAIREYLSAHD